MGFYYDLIILDWSIENSVFNYYLQLWV